MSRLEDQVILSAVSKMRDEAVDCLVELASHPAFGTTGDGYPECVGLVSRSLADAGLTVETIPVPEARLRAVWGDNLEKSTDYLPVSRFAAREVVLGRLPGTSRRGRLHLTQHYDLPAYLGAHWAAPVFEAGRVIGPGVSRCRAGLASMLMALRALRVTDVELEGGLFFSATPDNHLGGETGAGYMAEQRLGESEMVITGSAGGVGVLGLGYKGALWARITTRGISSTSAEPRLGINAIDKMMEVHQALRSLDRKLGGRGTAGQFFPAESRDPTLTATRIHAWANGVPDECVMYVDRRLDPAETSETGMAELAALLGQLKEHDRGLETRIDVVHAAEPASSNPKSPLAAAIGRNIERVTGHSPVGAMYSNYSEFRFFPHLWQADTVNYSPGPPDAALAGGPEYVAADDYVSAIGVLALTIRDLLAPKGRRRPA